MPPRRPGGEMRATFQVLVVIAVLVAAAAVWRLGLVDGGLDRHTLALWIAALRGHWYGYAATIGAFMGTGAALAPQTPLIAACAIVFGPLGGFTISIAGLLATATT